MLHPNLKYYLILKKIVMYECILKCAKLQKVTFLIIKKKSWNNKKHNFSGKKIKKIFINIYD